MNCDEAKRVLGAYHDGELGPLDASKVEDHLQTCEACRGQLDSIEALSAALQEIHAEPASEGLRSRLEAKFVSPTPRSSNANWLWLPAAAALIVAAFVGGRLTVPRADVMNDLVASHVRSLMGTHLMDVISTDRHTVKPWFAGKVDLTANPYDLKSDGFPLAGGRLDYVGGRQVPVFVYMHGRHVLNLYVLPMDLKVGSGQVRGYSVETWNQGDLEFAAVSDGAADDLKLFERLYRDQK